MASPTVSRPGSLVVVALLLLCAAMSGNGAEDERTAPPETHRESPDDPFVEIDRQQMRRQSPAVVVRGNHVSVQVNTDAIGNNILGDAANEPSMAVDPTVPSNIVIGWRQFDSVSSNFRQAGNAYSHDAGATWTFPGVIQPGQFRSDPVLAADNNGTFFYYSLSSVSSVEMFISDNKGLSWTGPFPGFGGDKEWMTVDITGGPGDGNVHTLWNSQFTCCAPGTDYTRSIDGGVTYEGPYAMPVKVKWGTLDVAPDGALYVVGANLNATATPSHYVLRSSNAFDTTQVPTFESSVSINLGGTTAAGAIPNPGGLLGQVWIAADRSGGTTDGNIYVLGSVDPPGSDPLDVKFIRSASRATSWTSPVRVNDDPFDNGAYQWFGALSVAPDGRIDVTWYDTRSDPSGIISEVYYAYSTNAGSSWSSGLPVTPPFNSIIGHPGQNKIGDYTQMFSDDVGAALAYAATFNGEQDVWFLRVGDCNDNGVHDSGDIARGISDDCNGNGIPDECETLAEICDDRTDNDCDDLIDCSDPDCIGDPQCNCNFNGICELDEDCFSCPTDCPTGPAGRCGDGICDASGDEDCLSCPEDCNGNQSGNPGNQFCCGAGGGVNPVTCNDARCSDGGFACVKSFVPACCGDLQCDFGESPCTCELDCGAFAPIEDACGDQIDNDCDDQVDCADGDCAAAAPLPPQGAPALRMERREPNVLLRWDAPPGAVAFDVVEGNLALLNGGGDFASATTGCVFSDQANLEIETTATGASQWYLVRPRFCEAVGSYDAGVVSQSAPRDASIADSPDACP
jgi:hypothetical protein